MTSPPPMSVWRYMPSPLPSFPFSMRRGRGGCLINIRKDRVGGGGGCTAPIYMYSNSLCFDKYDLPLSVFQLLVYWVVHTAGIKLRTFLYPCLQKSCQCERATVFVLAKVLFFSSVSYILGNTGMPCPFYIKTFNKISQESLY